MAGLGCGGRAEPGVSTHLSTPGDRGDRARAAPGLAGCGEQEMPGMGIPTGDTASTAWHSHLGWAGSSCQRQPARCQRAARGTGTSLPQRC